MPTAPVGPKEAPAEASQHKTAKKTPAPEVQPAKSKPSYSLDEVTSFQQEEEASQIIFIAEQYLGRVLTVPDIKTIIFLGCDQLVRGKNYNCPAGQTAILQI